MDEQIKTWLYNALNAMHEIDSFLGEKPKLFSEFKDDIRTKRAIERNLEILGKAVNRILKKDINFKFSHSPKIIDTRNRIIHGYDSVSDDVIWGIIINHLPALKTEIENLLKD